MYRHYNNKFQIDMVNINPGEYFVSKEEIIISTVLGSCVAVAFHDPVNKIGGLNHFMLPGNVNKDNFYMTESGKYGMFAMELLVNDLIKKGAQRRNLIAKVFGGGSVLRTTESYTGKIPKDNIEFAFKYLETEKFRIETSDVGGRHARKILYFPFTNKILLKRITGNLITAVEEEEEEYLTKIKKQAAKKNEATLF